jgi:hypothetical protein
MYRISRHPAEKRNGFLRNKEKKKERVSRNKESSGLPYQNIQPLTVPKGQVESLSFKNLVFGG